MSEGIRSRSTICHRAAWVSTIQREAIHGSVPHDVAAHAEIVLANNPGQRISEGDKILVQRAERIAPAVCESSESIAKADRRVAEGGKRERAYYGTVRGDITLVEADAG